MTHLERFMSKVLVREGCWDWQGRTKITGYGVFDPPRGESQLAYRWLYCTLFGKPSDDVELDHLCTNPACVRPDHLELVSHAVNVARGCAPTAINARKTHCMRGHPFTEGNYYVIPTGRKCKPCALMHGRRQQQRRKSGQPISEMYPK